MTFPPLGKYLDPCHRCEGTATPETKKHLKHAGAMALEKVCPSVRCEWLFQPPLSLPHVPHVRCGFPFPSFSMLWPTLLKHYYWGAFSQPTSSWPCPACHSTMPATGKHDGREVGHVPCSKSGDPTSTWMPHVSQPCICIPVHGCSICQLFFACHKVTSRWCFAALCASDVGHFLPL